MKHIEAPLEFNVLKKLILFCFLLLKTKAIEKEWYGSDRREVGGGGVEMVKKS